MLPGKAWFFWAVLLFQLSVPTVGKPQITAEAKHRGQIPCHGIIQFAVIAGNGTEEPRPVQPVLGMHQDFERRDWL